MKNQVYAAAAITIVMLSLFEGIELANDRYRAREEMEDEIKLLQELDAQLNTSILDSRIGLEQNYDRITQLSESIDREFLKLTNLAEDLSDGERLPFLAELASLKTALDKRSVLVEDVKSAIIVLNNATRYLPLLAADTIEANQSSHESERIVRDLHEKALTYLVNPDDNNYDALKQSTEVAKKYKHLKYFTDHILLIQTTKSKIDAKVMILFKLGQKNLFETIQEINNEAEISSQRLGRRIALVLYILCLVMIPFIFLMLAKVRLQNVNLDKAVKARTKQLEDQYEILVQSAKMASLGEMAGGIAHEINNPLGTILLRARHIQKLSTADVIDRDMIQKYCDVISKTGGRISVIIKGLRTFSRKEPNDAPFACQSIKDLIYETLALCDAALKRESIAVTVDIDSQYNDPMIECRPVQVSQVILNLLQNAMHEMKKRLPEDDRWIKIHLTTVDESVKVEVIDAGSGIPESMRERLFQPFFTTKDVGEGTGLGLSISRGLLESQGGKLYVDYHAKNTTFVIELPIRQSASQARAA